MLTFDNDFLPAAQDLMEADLNGRAAGKLFTVIEAASLDELREFRGGLRLLELNQRLRISTFGERFTDDRVMKLIDMLTFVVRRHLQDRYGLAAA